MKYLVVLCAIFATSMAAVKFDIAKSGGGVEILSKSFDLNEDGSYGWEFEAGNGIVQSENGKGGEFAKGAAEWDTPEGEHVVLQYTADENGYQPSGSHVPQVPEYIVRALEWIRTHPPADTK